MRPILFLLPSWLPGLGGQPVYSYGVLLGLAMIAGWYTTIWRARREGLSSQQALGMTAAALLGGLLGARLLFFASNPARWHGLSSLLELDSGGLVVYGGFLGGLAAVVVAARALSAPLWRYADCAAPLLAVGLALGRVGCFLYGCDFGRRAGVPWAVRFPRWTAAQLPWVGQPCAPGCGPLTHCDGATGLCQASRSAAWALHRELGYIQADDLFSAPVHPVQLYSVALGVGLALFLFWWHRRRAFQGQTLLLFVLLYAPARAALELLREDSMRGALLTVSDPGWWGLLLVPQVDAQGQLVHVLSTSQGISLLAAPLAVALWWLARRRPAQGPWWDLGASVSAGGGFKERVEDVSPMV